MNGIEIIVLTPPGMIDPSLAIAACRAGALGILDLEYFRPDAAPAAREAVAGLVRLGRGPFGLKLAVQNPALLKEMTTEAPPGLQTVILAGADFAPVGAAIQELRQQGLRVILECTLPEHAAQAETLGVDGVIAKGNEAGGRVGRESTFVFLQRLLHLNAAAVYAQGGIGLHTAAACRAAGAAGVVLDSQLWLTRESPLPGVLKHMLAAFDGSETAVFGEEIGTLFRICSRTGQAAIKAVRELERSLADRNPSPGEADAQWRQAVAGRIGWGVNDNEIVLAGQDIGMAAALAGNYVTVAGVVQAVTRSADHHVTIARREQPLAEHSPLALSHHTRYPIVQGPMARISDRPEFAAAVAEEGGLPFLAVSWMRSPELEPLLAATAARLKDLPWGVGLLGFLPAEVYDEQLALVLKYRPPFALLAGGRAHQVKALEKAGIATYVHVPSTGLLKLLLGGGARRFIFEGRESGGHVGPLSSFALWDHLVDTLLNHLPPDVPREELHVLFAGGIHDGMSAAMVEAVAAPLVECGIRVGVQLGSAYLLTPEAVDTGAIVASYQQAALECTRTVVLDTGGGHANRCIASPFAREFFFEKRRLESTAMPPDRIRAHLEAITQGKLRIAAKAVDRAGKDPGAGLKALDRQECWERGLYLIGEIAALRHQPVSIRDLHREICARDNSAEHRHAAAGSGMPGLEVAPSPSDVAIIGMGCIYPKAPDLATFWENILEKVDAVSEVPPERWDAGRFYSPDRRAQNKVYSRWGAFIDDIPFDPLFYGIPPRSLDSIEPVQLLALEAARRALADAGYARRPFPRERTAVILGMSGVPDLSSFYCFRSTLPLFFDEADCERMTKAGGPFPEWTEDSFPGILLNVTAGRIANRFDLGGTNFIVDGACASSLAAVYLAVRELESGSSEMVLVGGADTMLNPLTYQCFAKTQALSPTSGSRPLDEKADGIIIGEGVGLLVLKRLVDAERDGDRIYAVIKGIGAASDGRDKSLTAPRPEGQVLSLRRAYAKAGVSPASVELFEAHATGTAVGDQTEVESLTRFLTENGAAAQTSALGSVKSMIGHTKAAAGLASLIKAALALHRKVLPPTLIVNRPQARLCSETTPIYPNTEPRPWLEPSSGDPRRAGVSAFGFGGTNFHVVLEEHRDPIVPADAHLSPRWPAALFLWTAGTAASLADQTRLFFKEHAAAGGDSLDFLASRCLREYERQAPEAGGGRLTLAVVASGVEDLARKLGKAQTALEAGQSVISDREGVYFTARPLAREGRTAFLFPGQGSQYPGMLSDLAVRFLMVRRRFEESDRLLADRLEARLSSLIFPPPAFTEEKKELQKQALARTIFAQPAMGAADMALFRLLETFGIRPHMAAGHSYGELAALCAAGVFSEADLIAVSEARARFITEGFNGDSGIMAAVNLGGEETESLLENLDGVWVANLNSPLQTVITGTRDGVEAAVARCAGKGIAARRLPVSCAFHSPLMAPACDSLDKYLEGVRLGTPRLPVYSNLEAGPYPGDAPGIRRILVEHLTHRVEFVRQIEAMYEDGARIFVEAGPGRVLTGLVEKILQGRPHLAVVANQAGRSGLLTLQHLLAQLAANGVALDLTSLPGKSPSDADSLSITARPAAASATWVVNGARIAHKEQANRRPELPLFRLDHPDAPPSAAYSYGVQPLLQGTFADPRAKNLENPGSGDAERDGVMARHQRLMQQFLDTQKAVMLGYLGEADGRSSVRVPAAEPAGAMPMAADARQTVAPQPLAGKPEPLPAPAEPAETPAAAVSAPSILDSGKLKEALLRIVGERTGYPPEMIDLAADLEADLGIDSIKRVEILTEFGQTFDGRIASIVADLEGLSRIPTLGKIIAFVKERLFAPGMPPQGDKKAAETPASKSAAAPKPAELPPRITLKAAAAPPVNQAAGLAPGRTILITNDGRGVAEALKSHFQEQGLKVALIGEDTKDPAAGSYPLPEDPAAGIPPLIEAVRRECGPFAGLLHLGPLMPRPPFSGMTLADWRRRLLLETGTLFHLLQSMADDLKASARAGGSLVLGATAMGGSFASDPAFCDPEFLPSHGAVGGLLKTLAVEWPEVRFKAIDLDLRESAAALAGHLRAEIGSGDGLVEVGYREGRRLKLDLIEAPPAGPPEAGISPDTSWVILLTGGARGITAEIGRDLARRFRPTLVLAGTAPAPETEEAPATRGLQTPQEIKAALIKECRARGQAADLAQIELAYKRLLKEREIRKNLAAMEKEGARVVYRAVDVRDEAGFGALIDELYETCGRIDGVVHGAGIIEDKLFVDKSWESFSRVLSTKAESAFILSRRLRPDTLKFLAFFSSVAGRFANRGQSDYTAVNEIVNKLALYLNRRQPGRVVALNWGPWEKAGMVSDGIRRQFAERGVGLILPEQGTALFTAELASGAKSEVEIVLGDGPWREEAIAAPQTAGLSISLPFIPAGAAIEQTDGRLKITRRLDPATDRFLLDHCLEGKPVVAAAMAVELMAESASLGAPGRKVVGVRDARVLKGIILENGGRDLSLLARWQEGADAAAAEIAAEIRDALRPEAALYGATVVMARDFLPPEEEPLPEPPAGREVEVTVEQIYDRWLFHGPRFRCITHLERVCEGGIMATLKASDPAPFLGNGAAGAWALDPVLLDGAPQLAIVWARAFLDITPLPTRFRAIRIMGPVSPGQPVHCRFYVRQTPHGKGVHGDFYFTDAAGRPLMMIEGLETLGSKGLNRLAGSAAATAVDN